jgi:CRISPR-associated protein Cas1
MPTAYLTTPRLRVALQSERLEVTIPPDENRRAPEVRGIPLIDVEHVVIDAGISITTPALAALLQRGIPVVILSHGNLPAGIAMPLNTATTVLARQIDLARDPAFRLMQAKALIEAKILNQRRVIQRLAANRKSQDPAAPWLTSMANQAKAAASLDSLRGIEGAAAGRYFEALSAYFPKNLPFQRRTRRPPHNEANALLSFLYTLLAAEISLHLRAVGLEPGWGVYHEAEDHRPALALDLLEPFRAPVADALALDLINHRRLIPDDFQYEGYACLLKRASRRTVFAALEQRLEREFHSEQAGHRTTLRQIFKDTALAVKRTLNDNTPLAPFLMN